jgi:galactokinase
MSMSMRDDVSADAPGRVNLIGEHTDYHDGYVLPTVIPQRTHAHLTRRVDRLVRASSSAIDGRWEQYEAGRETAGRGWLDYVQGVTVTLARHGVSVPGFDVRIDSSIPVGAGVSSSAALEVSLLRALRLLLNLELDDVSLARMAQSVETDFVGAPVGIMDPLASSLGRDGEALFIDTRSLAVERVPIPASVEIVVIHSGVTHAHAGGEYVARRRESFEAAQRLGVSRLRDVDATMIPQIDALPGVLARRARHIVTENARVLAAADALRTGDAERLGALLNQSHVSMRDDYETSTTDIDVLVEIAQHNPAAYGARLTGGGFGGSIVAIVGAGYGECAAAEISAEYRHRTSRTPMVLVPPQVKT